MTLRPTYTSTIYLCISGDKKSVSRQVSNVGYLRSFQSGQGQDHVQGHRQCRAGHGGAGVGGGERASSKSMSLHMLLPAGLAGGGKA